MPSQPTTHQLQRAVSVICKVIGQIPCFYFYERFMTRGFASDEEETALGAMMHNAALDSALLNLRCFNEFFKPDGWPDDVRAHQFPRLSMQPFLSANEEEEINKHLAHLTTSRTDMAAKAWMINDLTVRGLRHGIQFTDFVDTHFPMHTKAASAEVRGVREGAKHVIRKITAGHGNQVD